MNLIQIRSHISKWWVFKIFFHLEYLPFYISDSFYSLQFIMNFLSQENLIYDVTSTAGT